MDCTYRWAMHELARLTAEGHRALGARLEEPALVTGGAENPSHLA